MNITDEQIGQIDVPKMLRSVPFEDILEYAHSVVALVLSEALKMTDEELLLTQEEAKEEILKHCSPETQAKDVVFSDIEQDLCAHQVVKCSIRTLALVEQAREERDASIIALFKERVEKVENPNRYWTANPIPEGSDPTAFTAVERFRLAILKSLEE